MYLKTIAEKHLKKGAIRDSPDPQKPLFYYVKPYFFKNHRSRSRAAFLTILDHFWDPWGLHFCTFS